MASDNKYDLPLLSDMHPRSNENVNPRLKTFASRTWSISFSIPMSSESYQNETNLVCFTAPLLAESRTPEIQMSSPLLISPISRNLFQPGHGVTGRKLLEPKTQTFPSCKAKDQNDRMDDKQGGNNEHLSRHVTNYDEYSSLTETSTLSRYQEEETSLHNFLCGDANGRARKFISLVRQYIPGVMNPHSKFVQRWNKFVVISCFGAIFIDPLFFLLLFTKQRRINECLGDACRASVMHPYCMKFIDCGHGNSLTEFQNDRRWSSWINNENATACFTVSSNGFDYGIYKQAVGLTTKDNFFTRYLYSLFWGFQQIGTLAGNQTPSYFIPEVLFIMGYNIDLLHYLYYHEVCPQSETHSSLFGRLEMSLRRHDIEQWMRHRRLPPELRRQVLEAERCIWDATRGVNEEKLLENLPEDLQKDIRRHLFKFVKEIPIFEVMDESILDAISGRLKQKIYTKGRQILRHGGVIEKKIFIVRGKLESVGEDEIRAPLIEGDVCGEELLPWCLEQYLVNKDPKNIRIPGQQLLSDRRVKCLTNVEAFSLRAADLEEVISLYTRFLLNPGVQRAIRYISPNSRCCAATSIQVAWRDRKKRLSCANTTQSGSSSKHDPII
ncbi:probable cyclic nucleotide-gated ion channel 20, chloroplastic [Tripterygium wilfordii]|uniref:probable cyclic nucleotide-gated ion channel 20, chloroplastic n=1 Tax=Tripterygium wilfordii TaxID=458696 RepID=UPI0018F7F022|nr:probable cyclic nucleotide-gated ion channel 20, chloroplastic [Tripterygium wilfordii]